MSIEKKKEVGQVTLELFNKSDNPRNSEGAFIELKDGKLLFIYSRFTGTNWQDEAPADIASKYSTDQGETWSESDEIIIKNTGNCNVMSVSLLRLQDDRIALFYCLKNSFKDLRTYVRFSGDEAQSWSEATCCIPAPGYFVCNNDRIIQLKSGRIIIPTSYHRVKQDTTETEFSFFDQRGIMMFFYSDDNGKTWQESETWWALPHHSNSGLQEPGIIEKQDGTLYAWARTSLGQQWELFSSDQGLSWSAPQPSQFISPCSPLSMKRIPTTKDLLAVWNDKSLGYPSEESSWGRTPLIAAISKDNGKTWEHKTVIESDPERGYCYITIHFINDSVLLAYCCGGRDSAVLQDTCIRKIKLSEIYKSK